MPTLKILFAEANACAHPDCDEPLTFEERGLKTVVVQIAHIRSESDRGPRFDPTFVGDLNGPENLLLLCGRHHPPVDRHERAYTVAELLTWKADQVARAGGGTPVTDDDLRSFVALGEDERRSLLTIAKVKQRVVNRCQAAQADISALQQEQEATRLAAAARFLPIDEVDEHGNRTRMDPNQMQLSMVERREWQAKMEEVWAAQRPRVVDALDELEEEIAALLMMLPRVAGHAAPVSLAARSVVQKIGDAAGVAQAIHQLDSRTTALWQSANGEID